MLGVEHGKFTNHLSKFISGTIVIISCLTVAPVKAQETTGIVQNADLNAPFLRVGKKYYRVKDIVGRDTSQLRKEFDDNLKNATKEDVASLFVKGGYNISNPDSINGTSTVGEAKEVLWNKVYGEMLSTFSQNIILSHLYENIVAENNIDIEKYFKVSNIKEALKREFDFLKFAHSNPVKDDAAYEGKLYLEAQKKYRFKLDQKDWSVIRDAIKNRPFFVNWSVIDSQNWNLANDISLKSLLVHYLLKKSVSSGIYNEKARELYKFRTSTVIVVDFEGYEGDKNLLSDVTAEIVNKEGEVDQKKLRTLQRWLMELPPVVKVSYHTEPGNFLVVGNNVPRIGELYEHKPNSYKLIGWSGRSEIQEDLERDKIFLKVYGYSIAMSENLPQIQVLFEDWKPKLDVMTSLVQADYRAYINDVEVDDFIIKEFPSQLFDEIAMHKAKIQTYSVEAAKYRVNYDKDAQDALIGQIKKTLETVESESVKAAYLNIVNKLSQK